MAIGIFISSLFIDFMTFIIMKPYRFLFPRKFTNKAKKNYLKKQRNIAIIISAYNESENIEKVIEHAFNQTLPPKKVIVINDNSTDNTGEICNKLIKKYKNLIVINQKENLGKSKNVSQALFKYVNEEFTIVLDADTFLSKNYIKEITNPFINKRVVISTGLSLPIKQKNFFGKIIYHGSIFQYKFFCFRKQAHSFRNAISVISGDSAAYRTSFLKSQGGLPEGTQTEDMDITWTALEKSQRVVFNPKAKANAKDAATFRGHWQQLTRWYAGSIQCVIKHGKKLLNAKSLLYTTLLPIFLDSSIYAIFFLLSIFFIFKFPTLVIGLYAADFIFTLIALAIVDRKGFLHLPEIYIIKFMWAAAWIYAVTKTFTQYIGGKRTWHGRWARDSYYIKAKPS